ncbi:hypothetical protein OIU79_003088 [Salix purpurea]|uniref:Uncharacterized protein n=1 Tax=Salix purpurea TaxID=77065 RepID=A0A9Q0UL50_SALPP|nr:hypothetical protein OIU79_003088 [Salix purpurea]
MKEWYWSRIISGGKDIGCVKERFQICAYNLNLLPVFHGRGFFVIGIRRIQARKYFLQLGRSYQHLVSRVPLSSIVKG